MVKDWAALSVRIRLLSPAPDLVGTMQVFLVSAPPKMPALCGHFCFFLNLLLFDQATFGPAFWPSEWLAAFHFRLHGFQDNG